MIEKLLNEGTQLSKKIDINEHSNKEISIWLKASIYYIETYYSSSILTRKFIKEFEEGTQELKYYFNEMLNILEAFKKVDDEEDSILLT